MKKTTRASIILIVIGVLLIVEAYLVPSGGHGPSQPLVSANSIESSKAPLLLFRGQTLECSITGNASVNLYVVDETNYLAFANGNSWQPVMTLLDVSNKSFNFVVPKTDYYRTIAVVGQFQENAELSISVEYYGINLDYYQPGLGLVVIGAILVTTDTILYLKSRSSEKTPEKS